MDVDLAQVAIDMWQPHEARIHHFEPQGRQVGDDIHAVVAARQARQIGKVPQALIAPSRIGVVVRVSLQMK